MKTVLRGTRLRLFLSFIAIAILPVSLSSQEPIESNLFSGMLWRSIGPFRAGRVTSVAGATDRNTYYFGTPFDLGSQDPVLCGQIFVPK